jgi:alkylation response protein AidB-like acyl-CoA dehydrogenase
MYGLSEEDLQIQARARGFADELIPFEDEAERADGQLPADVTAAHAKRCRELGLHSTNMPRELGGGGCTSLQQVLVQEQMGRVTNALGWVAATPPSWLPAVATQDQIDRYVRPAVAGEREECYAITEEGAGSDVDAIEATARRDGEDYLLSGVKWHVTSYNSADFAFFQAKLPSGDHAMFLVDLPSPGVRVVRTPAYSHTISHHHPIVEFTDVRVPAANLVGAEGDGMDFAYEWFRFERLMVAARCLGAAARLVDEMTAFAAARVVGGQPISEYGLVAGMLADSLTEAVRGPGAGLRDRPRHRRQRRREGVARAVLDGQALRLGNGGPGRRPRRPGVRRPRLHARERGRALLPRAPRRADLGRHQRNPAHDHRPPDDQTPPLHPRLTPPAPVSP